MTALRRRLQGAGPAPRMAALLVLVVAIGAGGPALVGGAPRERLHRAGGNVEALLDAGGGRVVVDTQGRPVRGADGRPLRVGPDGRTLTSADGRPLRDRRGRPLRITPRGRLPEAARDAIRPPEARRRERPRRGGARRRPGAPPAPAAAPGKAPPVVIDAWYHSKESSQAAAVALGFVASAGDPAAQLGQLQAYVNRTGGILGRELRINATRIKAEPAKSYDVTATEYCAGLRESRPLAVLTIAGRPAVLAPCVAELGAALFGSFVFVPPRAFLDRHAGHFFAPAGVAADRLVERYVDGLERSGFFGAGARAGILAPGVAWTDRVLPILQRAVRAAGARVAATRVVRAESPEELLQSGGQVGEAVREFKARGVTHVVGIDVSGILTKAFMRHAVPQLYWPRYGLNSTHDPHILSAHPGPERAQLRRAVGVGWAPVLDVPESRHPASPAVTQCREILDPAVIGDQSLIGHYYAYTWCDSVLTIRAALERAGEVSLAGLRRGLESLGTSHPLAAHLRTRLDSDRHDGTGGFSLMRYDDDAGMTYEGSIYDG